ncbi:HTH-type transcriptional repressor YcgE [compost metagenome]
MPPDAMHEPDAHAPQWLPIREVARLTGVNRVTLRAWERRYGLIVPQRTAKGHRLYSQEHVDRIQHILLWLSRGVAASQVKALLQCPAPALPLPHADGWSQLRRALLENVGNLAERRLDESINQAMALYPPLTLCEHLWVPLLGELELRWQGQFGMQMERVFFLSWLRSKLGARIYYNNRQLSGSPLLLINHSDLALDPQLWLTAWLVSSAGCRVEVFDWPLPAGELALAVDRLAARAVLLSVSKRFDTAQLERLLQGIHCPKLLFGQAVIIHKAVLCERVVAIAHLHLREDLLSAFQCLQHLKLLQSQST